MSRGWHMADDWKYVLFELELEGEVIVIFPPHLAHSAVRIGGKAISAGFVRYDEETHGLTCYGRSVTLNLDSRPGDSWFANKLMGSTDDEEGTHGDGGVHGQVRRERPELVEGLLRKL